MNDTKDPCVHSVYAYVFDDERVYIGLTTDVKTRNSNHRHNPDSAVFRHWVKLGRGDFPEMFVLCDGLSLKEAGHVEDMLANAIAPELRLNRARAGAPGAHPAISDERRRHLLATRVRRKTGKEKVHCARTAEYYEARLSEFCGMMAWRAKVRRIARTLPAATRVMMRRWGEVLAGDEPKPRQLFVNTRTGYDALRIAWAARTNSDNSDGIWSGPGQYSLGVSSDGSGGTVATVKLVTP